MNKTNTLDDTNRAIYEPIEPPPAVMSALEYTDTDGQASAQRRYEMGQRVRYRAPGSSCKFVYSSTYIDIYIYVYICVCKI